MFLEIPAFAGMTWGTDALGTLATIMFVEGPDGILFEFAGPLLERFK